MASDIKSTGFYKASKNIDGFKTQVETFLSSIKEKNCSSFLKFLSKDTNIFAVFPDGKIARGYDEFVQSQRFWFESVTGSFDYKIHHIDISGEFGFAGVTAELKLPAATGTIYSKIYISFLFEQRGESWFMIHDQNTLIERNELP